ncbi:MAG: fumarylacetoacetate hydrolase family protein [Acidiferrobacterales bacterium]|nr:fumarylacetoacetate hydrolase family protein [Acidiferrobacterales bacterium]
MILKNVKLNDEILITTLLDEDWVALSSCNGLIEFLDQHDLDSKQSGDLLGLANLSADNLRELQRFLINAENVSLSSASACLPVEAKSFRDFMLFEQHVIDSTRGYVKRFLPKLYPITRAIEVLTGKSFKRFRPHKLWYQQPIYYFGNHLNMGMSGEDVSIPSYTNALDYELEIGAVLSRPIKDASIDEARAAIGGFVILNDFSARDVQKDEMESGFGPQKAKHFYSTMSCEFLTARDIDFDESGFTGTVQINGKVVSRCSSQNLKYSFAEAISHASNSEQLHAGEVFGSGTLPGGSGMETGNWVHRGDTLTLVINQIGELTNTIV